MTRLGAVAAVLFFVLSSACGKKGIGEACGDTTECGTGTTCIINGGRHIDAGQLVCDNTLRLCSKTCAADSDCASLGSGTICIKDCAMGSCLQGSRK